jgi:hypothetical protein
VEARLSGVDCPMNRRDVHSPVNSYTVLFQFLSDDRSVWIHDERTVTADSSADALQTVVQEVQSAHQGMKCIIKQIKTARSEAL